MVHIKTNIIEIFYLIILDSLGYKLIVTQQILKINILMVTLIIYVIFIIIQES